MVSGLGRCCVCEFSTATLKVTFDAESQGQLAMVIYEWKDYEMLGKVTSEIDDFLPVRCVIPYSHAFFAEWTDLV
jgi:hypothetical protein